MRLFLCALLSFSTLNLWGQNSILPEPKGYVCYQTQIPIDIDGLALETDWVQASFTDFFTDIQGDKKLPPDFSTRVKMLWDSSYFYFYAEMEEPHLSAKITERDAVIFHDNDIEIFIDPDGNTHDYYEVEMNALNTVWDLLLTKPYRDGGRAVNHWDIKGLKTAVHLNGTINDPSDVDKGWSVEIAIPWRAMKEATRMKTPPREGDQWRLNFSRVQWEMEVINGEYVKKKNPDTGKNLPENNWVWSPQRAVAMHEPEFWGLVQFTAKTPDNEVPFNYNQRADYYIRGMLYAIHRAQRKYYRKHKTYSSKLGDLDVKMGFSTPPLEAISIEQLEGHARGYILAIKDHQSNTEYSINETGLRRKVKR